MATRCMMQVNRWLRMGLASGAMRRLAPAALLAAALPAAAPGQGELVGWGESVHLSRAERHGLALVRGRGQDVLALRRDGSLVAWGPRPGAEGRPPLPGERFVDIAVGNSVRLALRDDGVVIAWGRNAGACEVPEPNTGFTAVAAAGGGCLGLRADGSIAAWGNASWVSGLPAPNGGFVAVAASDFFAVALRSNGTLVMWGDILEWSPPPLPAGSDFVALSAGLEHFLALRRDGSIAAWGEAWSGTGVGVEPPLPNAGFVAIASGDRHCLALRRDGTVAAWGWNRDLHGMSIAGQCDGPPPNPGIVAIGAAGECSYAVDVDGELLAWGSRPEVALPNAGFVALGDGGAVRRDGTAVAWRDHWPYEGSVPPLHAGVTRLSGSAGHTLALMANGYVEAWGSSGMEHWEPSWWNGALAVAADDSCSLVVDLDGVVHAGGTNSDGLRDVPEPNVGFRDLSAAGGHALGLKADGTVVAWGRNGHRQCDVPALPGACAAVAAGDTHSLALTTEGIVVAWGANGAGQCDVPQPNRDFVAIAAGAGHSLGLKADGSIKAWGDDRRGQAAVPPLLDGFSAVAARGDQSWAIRGARLVAPTIAAAPAAARPLAAAPNPFNPRTTVSFSLAAAGEVALRVFDVRGRCVRALAGGWHAAGPHAVAWDGTDGRGAALASGTYLCALETTSGRQVARVMLVR